MLTHFFTEKYTTGQMFTRQSMYERFWVLFTAKVNLAMFCSLELLESIFIMGFLFPGTRMLLYGKHPDFMKTRLCVYYLRNRMRMWHCISVLRKYFLKNWKTNDFNRMTSFTDNILLACENILPRKCWLLCENSWKWENRKQTNKTFLGLP